MDRLYYAGDTILTGTAIAHAVLEYAEALALAGESASVDIPTRIGDGISLAKVLVGPASQLVTETQPDEGEELVDEELVARLKLLTAQTGQKHSTVAVADDTQAHVPEWSDEL